MDIFFIVSDNGHSAQAESNYNFKKWLSNTFFQNNGIINDIVDNDEIKKDESENENESESENESDEIDRLIAFLFTFAMIN